MDFEFQQVVSTLVERIEKLGLYTMNTGGGIIPASEEDALELAANPMDPRQMLEDGKAEIFVTLTCAVGDVAWSDRVLYPEKDKINKEFMTSMPTEVELSLDTILDDISKNLNEDED